MKEESKLDLAYLSGVRVGITSLAKQLDEVEKIKDSFIDIIPQSVLQKIVINNVISSIDSKILAIDHGKEVLEMLKEKEDKNEGTDLKGIFNSNNR